MPRTATFEVFRGDWDSLEASIRFEIPRWPRADLEAIPDSVRFLLFSSAYDTLFVGASPQMRVPDHRLSDREPLLLEACGWFDAVSVCDQRTVEASPKRVSAHLEIAYPDTVGLARDGQERVQPGDWGRVAWRSQPVVQRQSFGSVEWEDLPGAVVPPLAVRVGVLGGEGEPVEFALRGREGRLDLARLPGYGGFRFDIRSSFRDSAEAVVRFEAVARFGESQQGAGSVSLRVRSLDEEEELRELSALVEEAARHLVDRLFEPGGPARIFVFVNAWTYDPGTGRYAAEVEVHRREGPFGSWHDATGEFSVSIEGERPVFRLTHAAPTIVERWMDAVHADSLVLPDLPDPRVFRPTSPRR